MSSRVTIKCAERAYATGSFSSPRSHHYLLKGEEDSPQAGWLFILHKTVVQFVLYRKD